MPVQMGYNSNKTARRNKKISPPKPDGRGANSFEGTQQKRGKNIKARKLASALVYICIDYTPFVRPQDPFSRNKPKIHRIYRCPPSGVFAAPAPSLGTSPQAGECTPPL